MSNITVKLRVAGIAQTGQAKEVFVVDSYTIPLPSNRHRLLPLVQIAPVSEWRPFNTVPELPWNVSWKYMSPSPLIGTGAGQEAEIDAARDALEGDHQVGIRRDRHGGSGEVCREPGDTGEPG